MVKVLHIFSEADIGGVSAVVLNYFSHIDRDRISFDVALTSREAGRNGEKMKALGANVFFLPLKSEGVAEYKKKLGKLLEKGRYGAVHVHENETSYVALSVAKKYGVPVRVAHMHSAYPANGAYMKLRRLSGRLLNKRYATHLAACGRFSGEVMYGKGFKPDGKRYFIIPNALDLEKFSFDPGARERVRAEMGLTDSFVMLCAGRLAPEKNVTFAVDAAKKVKESVPCAALIIAGDGDEKTKIEEKIRREGAQDFVTLCGRVDDMPSLYSAADVLLMPSLYEGFPVVAAEALACGLPCILSDNVTDELSFSPQVMRISLYADVWAKETAEFARAERASGDKELLARHGLDIRKAVRSLEDIYLCRK